MIENSSARRAYAALTFTTDVARDSELTPVSNFSFPLKMIFRASGSARRDTMLMNRLLDII